MTMPAPQEASSRRRTTQATARNADQEIDGGREQVAEEPGDEQGDDDALGGLEDEADGDDGEEAEGEGGGAEALGAIGEQGHGNPPVQKRVAGGRGMAHSR
jgi:hypothetical protein